MGGFWGRRVRRSLGIYVYKNIKQFGPVNSDSNITSSSLRFSARAEDELGVGVCDVFLSLNVKLRRSWPVVAVRVLHDEDEGSA